MPRIKHLKNEGGKDAPRGCRGDSHVWPPSGPRCACGKETWGEDTPSGDRYIVTLSVRQRPGENEPGEWDWTALTDALPGDIRVVKSEIAETDFIVKPVRPSATSSEWQVVDAHGDIYGMFDTEAAAQDEADELNDL